MKRKRIEKQWLAVFTAAALTMGVFAGCGKKTENNVPAETQTEETESVAMETPKQGDAGESMLAEALSQLLKEKYAEEETVEYGEGRFEIARNETFLVDVEFDPIAAGMDAYPQIAALYADQELTREIPATYDWADEEKKSYTIAPYKTPRTAVTLSEADPSAPGYTENGRFLFDLGEGEDWGNYSTMYLAQWVDLKTGEKLEKPLVSVVTVKGELETPEVRLTTTEDGIAEFSWNEIPGATEYYVLEIPMNQEGRTGNARVIARTSQTSWSDKVERDSITDAAWKANSRFANYLISEDDWYSESMLKEFGEKYNPEDGPVKENSEYLSYYTVMAVNESGTSMFGNIFSGDEMASLLPCTLAINMEKLSDMGFSGYVQGVPMMPAYRWIILCDGSLSQRLVEYDMAAAEVSQEKIYTYEKEDMSDMKVVDVDVIKVPYKVQGTPFDGTLVVENYDKDNYLTQLQSIQERQDSLRTRTGTVDNGITVKRDPERKSKGASDAITVTEDNITANCALSEYLAVAMIAGTEEINITAFPEAGDPAYLADAWAEAVYQNPLVLGVSGAWLSDDRTALLVEYEQDQSTRVKHQDEIRNEVKKVTESIIKGDMSPLEKEYAINQYLCETAEYDFAALENAEENDFITVDPSFYDSFNAYGILVNKVGVCAGYSAAFKLLADAAGLESVVVTGYLEGATPHAWNRVNLDGNWNTLDVTNNDMDDLPNALLNLPDYALGSVLVEDDRYAINDALSGYVSEDMESEYYMVNDKFYSMEEIAQEFADRLSGEKTVVLRTDYRITDKDFFEIGSKVVELTGNPNLGGFYWMGVIVITSEM